MHDVWSSFAERASARRARRFVLVGASALVLAPSAVLLSACDTPLSEAPPEPGSTGLRSAELGADPASGGAEERLSVDPGGSERMPIKYGIATLEPTRGNEITGTVRFESVSDGLKVTAEVSGGKPGKHAFHVHLLGDCSGPDAKTAGPHFDFEGSSLNPPPDIQRITGDLGELAVDPKGRAKYEATISKATLQGPFTILGRSVVVHERPNDPTKPPEGDTGARIACGVVGVSAPGIAKE